MCTLVDSKHSFNFFQTQNYAMAFSDAIMWQTSFYHEIIKLNGKSWFRVFIFSVLVTFIIFRIVLTISLLIWAITNRNRLPVLVSTVLLTSFVILTTMNMILFVRVLSSEKRLLFECSSPSENVPDTSSWRSILNGKVAVEWCHHIPWKQSKQNDMIEISISSFSLFFIFDSSTFLDTLCHLYCDDTVILNFPLFVHKSFLF